MKILFLLFAFTVQAAWSKDLTESYLRGKNVTLLSQVRALQKFKVLIVPGVLAESFLRNSDNQIKLDALFSDAFKEQILLMEKLKIDYEFIKLETENSPEVNAHVISDAILKSTRPVLIYSHSKGGLDTLEAIRQNPDLLSRIHGWASIQSPFYGSPVASGFNNNDVLKQTGDSLFELMGGTASGMSSLTMEERTEYMNQKDVRDLIQTIKTKIHFINYASFKTNTLGVDTPLELFRNYTEEKAGMNDGVVPLRSALLPDVDFIIESEVDHLMTMTHYYLNLKDYNQKAHTMSVLKLLL